MRGIRGTVAGLAVAAQAAVNLLSCSSTQSTNPGDASSPSTGLSSEGGSGDDSAGGGSHDATLDSNETIADDSGASLDAGSRDAADGGSLDDGSPATCAASQLGCPGGCADPLDLHTCGSCTRDCSALSGVYLASVVCGASTGCGYTCAPGHADCADAGTGCADLSRTDNCGGCGVVCSGGAPLCGPIGDAGAFACTGSCPSSAPTTCAGSCVDLETNGKNCASCGHDCGGGSCSAGTCKPALLASLSGIRTAALAVDATTIYWTDGVTAISKVPLSGGLPAKVVSGLNSPGWIGVAAGRLYFDQLTTPIGGQASLMTVPVSGGTPVPFVADFSRAAGTQIESTTLYWVQTLTDAGAGIPRALATPFDGGLSAILGQSGVLSQAIHMTLSPTTAYIAVYGAFDAGTVQAVQRAGGAVTTFVPNASPYIDEVAVDATSVYWTTSEATGGTVMKVPIDGGTPVKIGSAARGATSILADSTGIYWLDVGVGTNPYGAVERSPLDGGPPVSVAPFQQNPGGLIRDATSLYWYSDFGIFRLVIK